MFKFSQTARKVMYAANAIESLNSGFRRLNRSRTVFPNAQALILPAQKSPEDACDTKGRHADSASLPLKYYGCVLPSR